MLNLYIDTASNQLLVGLNTPALVDPQALPFFFGDTLPLQIWLLEPSHAGNAAAATSYDVQATTGRQLKVYLTDGEGDMSVYAAQLAFDTDQSQEKFFGNLALNTTELQTLLTDKTEATAWLVIGYVENGLPRTVLAQQIKVRVGMPEPVFGVPPGETALSVEVASATYLTKIPVAGQPIYLKSPDGKIIALLAVDNPDGTATFQANPVN